MFPAMQFFQQIFKRILLILECFKYIRFLIQEKLDIRLSRINPGSDSQIVNEQTNYIRHILMRSARHRGYDNDILLPG
ncbi:hypothetical protein D3C78_1677160 [compost metagenome]